MKFHPHPYVVNLIITNESLRMESGEYISCPQRESVDGTNFKSGFEGNVSYKFWFSNLGFKVKDLIFFMS